MAEKLMLELVTPYKKVLSEEVEDDKATVLVQTAERADEIDLERAKAALGRAEDMLKKLTPEDKQFIVYEAALERAVIRMQVAGKAVRK
ncbi:MAG: synthase epsilon subunit [Deltaproteobacteria bacterium]|nr:synthase epsilon subunit [Deltaproteobacteria bacterium]